MSLTRRQRDWAKSSGPDEYKIVSVRLRLAEFEELDIQARALGLTNNMAVRIAIRKIAGFLETDSGTRKDLDTVVSAIGRIADDLGRLSNVCERNGSADLQTLNMHRNELGREFRKLDGLLRDILNTGRRRVDGRFLLGESVG